MVYLSPIRFLVKVEIIVQARPSTALWDRHRILLRLGNIRGHTLLSFFQGAASGMAQQGGIFPRQEFY